MRSQIWRTLITFSNIKALITFSCQFSRKRELLDEVKENLFEILEHLSFLQTHINIDCFVAMAFSKGTCRTEFNFFDLLFDFQFEFDIGVPCQSLISNHIWGFLLERYEKSNDEEDSLLNLNIEILNNQYHRVRDGSKITIKKTEFLEIY